MPPPPPRVFPEGYRSLTTQVPARGAPGSWARLLPRHWHGKQLASALQRSCLLLECRNTQAGCLQPAWKH